jgi:hypothetical protein
MIGHIHQHTLPAAMYLLPDRMNSPAACAMLLAIGLQESRFQHRVQIGGPARGLWQFEKNGGVRGVLEHHASRPWALNACAALLYKPDPYDVYSAIANNDTLAACFARLLLWTHPRALPSRGDHEGAWRYYLAQWRPGKPHRRTWDAFYDQAWSVITGE